MFYLSLFWQNELRFAQKGTKNKFKDETAFPAWPVVSLAFFVLKRGKKSGKLVVIELYFENNKFRHDEPETMLNRT